MDQPSTQHSRASSLLALRYRLSRRSGLLIVLLLALLTRMPTPFAEFATDDYLIRAMVVGDAGLYAMGFEKADPSKGFWQRLADGFHFYSPAAGTREAYQDYGNLPWWASDDAKMNPLRPLSAFTHWLDFQLAPDSFALQAMHSLLYVLLMTWASYRLFWRLRPEPVVAVLATLLLTVDFSHLMNFSWIAARNVFIASALGCVALERFLVWREQGGVLPLLASLLAFVAGLLSAENAISILAYMGAYALFVERISWLRKGAVLLPFLAVVLVWRWIYNQLGHGAAGIGLYLDPGHDFLGFLESLVQVLPVILAGMITTLDGTVSSLAPDVRIWVTVISVVILITGLRVIWPFMRRDAIVRFMLLGSIVAAVPASALISAGPRASAFSSIGFFWLLAVWLHNLAVSPGWRLRRMVLAGAVGLHIVLPVLTGFLLTSRLLPVTYVDDGRFSSVAKSFFGMSVAPALVLVNSPSPNKEYYLPFEWYYRYGQVPASLNLLAPGVVSLNLTRLGPHTFELSALAGLPLHHRHDVTDLRGHHPLVSSAFAAQMLQGLMVSPDRPLRVGDQLHAGDIRVTVLALKEDRPSRLKIEFAPDVSPDQMVWQYYDWQTRSYRAMGAPAIGKTMSFPGPFDTPAGTLVNLCLGCENARQLNGR